MADKQNTPPAPGEPCATYRRTHFVETRPCCDVDAKARPVVVVELPDLAAVTG